MIAWRQQGQRTSLLEQEDNDDDVQPVSEVCRGARVAKAAGILLVVVLGSTAQDFFAANLHETHET